jgi:hypothetical protein
VQAGIPTILSATAILFGQTSTLLAMLTKRKLLHSFSFNSVVTAIMIIMLLVEIIAISFLLPTSGPSVGAVVTSMAAVFYFIWYSKPNRKR